MCVGGCVKSMEKFLETCPFYLRMVFFVNIHAPQLFFYVVFVIQVD